MHERGTITALPLRADVRHRWAEPRPGPADPGAEPGEGALGSYLRAVRAHLVLVIAVTLACGIAAIAWGPGAHRDLRGERADARHADPVRRPDLHRAAARAR